MFEKLNKAEATPFKFDYQYDAPGHPENIYCRSDHYNYARFGIPIVFVDHRFTRRLSPGDGRAGVHRLSAHGEDRELHLQGG